jgi:outer membrane protein TolC
MSRLEVSKIRKKKSILNYEYSIQDAFREVASGLISKKNYRKQIDAQGRVVKAAQKTSKLSDLRYRSGVDSYLVSLDSRRSLYEAQTKYIQIKQNYIRNNIFLFKALGGGEVGVVLH